MEGTMGQLIAAQQNRREEKRTDLFSTSLPAEAGELRSSEQRERLARIAEELAELLDELESRLRADRGRAVPIAAEYLAPLETAAENLSRVRDIDEQFGGRSDRPPRMAHQAEQLEKGLAYLLGVLSVAVTSDNLSPYNWRLVERDVQEVHAIAGNLQPKEREPTLKAAA
jgi:hypothetical protein